MHLLEVVSARQSNGVIAHFRLLAPALRARGHRVTLLLRAGSPFPEEFRAGDFEVLESDLHRWPGDELARIGDFVRAEGVDVVHAHMSRANNFGVRLQQRTGVPCVLTAHALTWHLHWRAAAHVLAVSEATAAWHRRRCFVPPERISTVLNFVAWPPPTPDPAARAALRQEWGIGAGEFVLGTVGDIIPRKGHDLLVRALARMQRPARLVVVGRGEGFLETVRRDAERLGVGERIVWAGFRRDIGNVLSALDTSVLASRRDPCPMAVVEAMAAGLPVVGTRVDGIPEFVADGVTGWLADSGDTVGLAAALDRAVSATPEARGALGRAAQEFIAANATVESQVPRIEAALAAAFR